MKTMFNKVLSMICIMTMLLSCITITGVQAADDVEIITAQFLPYDQELRVLADIPEGASAKILVDNTEITTVSTTQAEGTLLTSANFTPSVYGIVPVTLEVTSEENVITKTKNVKFVKAFSTAESLSEDFNSFEPMTMSDTTDTSVVNAVKSKNNGQTLIGSIPTSSYAGRYADITNTYTTDNSSALTLRFQATADKGLPSVVVAPDNDGTNGIIEISYDFYTTNQYIRQTIIPVSRAQNSNLTFTTQDGTVFASSFQAANFSTFCFGSSDKVVEPNKWYNIRFLLNVNALTFEFYVNNELINYGSYIYNSSKLSTPDYIYGINKFDLAAGAQGKAGASEESPVNITFDNIKVTHTNIGAAVAGLSYTSSDETIASDIVDAKIPSYTESISVNMDNALVCAANNVTLQKTDGSIVDATVTFTDGEALSAKANRSVITIAPAQNLSIGEFYKIVISGDAKFGSNAYEHVTTIPFMADGDATIILPASDSQLVLGEVLNIKAYTPDCTSADLYVNDEYISTLYTDASEFVSYAYDTTLKTAGKKYIKLVLTKNDGTFETISSEFDLTPVSGYDIVPLETFENTVSSDYFTVTKQTVATSASMVQEEVGGRNAAAFYFVAKDDGSRGKAIQVTKNIGSMETGRVALEFDLYIADANKTAELSISFDDGTYTFYPMDIVKLFTKGKIAGQSMAYNGWHSVKLVMDTVDQSSELYFDGNQVGETCYTYANTYHKSGVEDPTSITGFDSFKISIWQFEAYKAGETYLSFAVDNWHIYREYPLPEFDSVTAGEELSEGQLINSDVKAFSVDIANAKYCDNESLISNFALKANGEAVATQNAAIADGTLTFDVANLPENAALELVIGADTLLYDNTTTLGADVVYNLKTADANGLYSKRSIIVGDTDAKAVFSLDSFAEKTVDIIVASYNGNKLVSIDSKPVTVNGTENIALTISKDGATKVKAFVWNGVGNLVPLSAGEVSVQTASQN